MFINDVKKGAQLRLKSGWVAWMMDNKKGLIRLCDVEGLHREMGSVYAHDIAEAVNPATGQWEKVQLSPDQLKKSQKIKALGF